MDKNQTLARLPERSTVEAFSKAAPVAQRPMAQQPGKAETTACRPHLVAAGQEPDARGAREERLIPGAGRVSDRPPQERYRERCEMNGALRLIEQDAFPLGG